jgi:hypothetical protein
LPKKGISPFIFSAFLKVPQIVTIARGRGKRARSDPDGKRPRVVAATTQQKAERARPA